VVILAPFAVLLTLATVRVRSKALSIAVAAHGAVLALTLPTTRASPM
jgi:hypothetical protein